MITQGISTSKPNRDIELKWFDSLIGYDKQYRVVPIPKLSAKSKYGISNNPKTVYVYKQSRSVQTSNRTCK